MIAFQLLYEYGEYTHGDILATSTDYDAIEKQFHEFLGECLMDSDNNVDYVAIETIDVEFDSDGYPSTDDDKKAYIIETYNGSDLQDTGNLSKTDLLNYQFMFAESLKEDTAY